MEAGEKKNMQKVKKFCAIIYLCDMMQLNVSSLFFMFVFSWAGEVSDLLIGIDMFIHVNPRLIRIAKM